MSDDRIKHNEVDLSNCLDTIRKLKPQKYQKTTTLKDENYNGVLNEPYTDEAGLIAQDLLQIPELAWCVGFLRVTVVHVHYSSRPIGSRVFGFSNLVAPDLGRTQKKYERAAERSARSSTMRLVFVAVVLLSSGHCIRIGGKQGSEPDPEEPPAVKLGRQAAGGERQKPSRGSTGDSSAPEAVAANGNDKKPIMVVGS